MMIFVKRHDPAVALHTVHLPLREALRRVTKRRLVQNLLFLAREYPRLFGRSPRIAVAGLNPHAGEDGLLGAEEERTVAPAVREACARGVRAEGPFAPDTVFLQAKARKFDVVFALYHDQGLIAAKAQGLFRYVNLTLGLPFVRTSPDHGVACELTGTGRADDRGMREAVLLAARLARRGVS
jgi:4-hydroxythreonine-4-phosphate dehydrogenase